MTIGIIAIWMSFTAAIVAITGYVLYYKDGQEELLQLANRSFYVMSSGIVISLGLLIYLINTHQFQVNFVYSYSSTTLNPYYLFSTLWAGQEGTFLLWLFYGCIYGTVLIWSVSRKHPLVLVFVTLVQAYLLLILLKKSPFAMVWHIHENVLINQPVVEGAGLNPLLQNPWMVIHPPTLFVGYSSTVVPFAFAMSAMITKDFTSWIKLARPWILLNVMVLGAGLIMGGYWAYTTLGWGGYWAWDPVENASLVPWLFSVVLLHGVVVQSKRKSLIKTNLLLAGASFLTMVWGSFLTRSGVLTDFSVHSFGESGLNFYLLIFQLLFTGLFFYFFIRAAMHLSKDSTIITRFENGIFNRETFIWIGMLILLFQAVLVLVATAAPIYTPLFFDNPSSPPPEWYNTRAIPVVIFMLLTLSIAPLLAWKTSEFRNKSTVLWSAAAAAIITAMSTIWLNEWQSIVLIFLALTVIFVNLKVASALILRRPTKAGAYIAHVGFGFMIIGIMTSSVYDTSNKIMLPKGEFTQTSFGYDVKFVSFVDMPDGKDRVKLVVKNGQAEYEAFPQFYYSEYSKAYMVAPDVKVEFGKDIYISPISFTPAEFTNQESFSMKKQESTSMRDIQFTFHDFNVEMEPGSQTVTANITATVMENGYPQEYQIHPRIRNSSGKMTSSKTEVPGTPYELRINAVSATDGTVDLALLLPREEGKAPVDMLAVEVSEKPLISVLWFGTIVFICGIFATLLGHIRAREK